MAADDLADRLSARTEIAELRATTQRLQRQLAQSKAKTAQIVDAIEQAARDAAISVGVAKIPPRPAKDKRTRKPEVALIHTTDWQVGKRTETYDSEVARRRLTVEMPETIETYVAAHRNSYPVREAHYMFGGDMVEGVTIFPGQVWEIDSTLTEQLFNAAQIEETIILHALTLFDTVHVWEEEGNHGRVGARGELPDNIDTIMYRIVRERFRHEPRAIFHPRPEAHFGNLVTIGNYVALLFHGDEIRSFGALPAFAIMKRVTKWLAILGFKDAHHGHYHTPMTQVLPTGGFIFGTGSPETSNLFALAQMGETGTASQRIHFVDPERGRITAQHIIDFR